MNDIAPPGIGHNSPPEPIDIAAERVDREVASATAWIEQVKVIKTEEQATTLATKLKQLRDLRQEYDRQYRAERKPHDDKVAEVKADWVPLIEKLLICYEKALLPLEKAWLRERQRQDDEDREKRRNEAAEAQRLADQLTEQAKAGGPGVVFNTIAAMEAAAEADRARQAVAAVPLRAQVRDALGSPARSLHQVWHAQVVDWDLWYAQVRNRGEVRDLLSQLANAAVRNKNGPRPPAGATEGMNPAMPGCWLLRDEN